MGNTNFGTRICKRCGKEYTATGARQMVCAECCLPFQREKALARYYAAKAAGKVQKQWDGVYKGYNQKGKNNNAYKTGIGTYRATKGPACELCGATKNLLVHHKDHDRTNNRKENLMTVCKRCHQQHHCIRDKAGRFTKHTKV